MKYLWIVIVAVPYIIWFINSVCDTYNCFRAFGYKRFIRNLYPSTTTFYLVSIICLFIISFAMWLYSLMPTL